MAALNFVATVTVTAGATVGLFAGSSQTPTAGSFYLRGVPSGVVACNSGGTGANMPLKNGSWPTGGAEFYVKNTSSATATISLVFASTA